MSPSLALSNRIWLRKGRESRHPQLNRISLIVELRPRYQWGVRILYPPFIEYPFAGQRGIASTAKGVRIQHALVGTPYVTVQRDRRSATFRK